MDDFDGKKLWKAMDALVSEAAAEEIAKHHAAGRTTTHMDGGGRIYRLYPDGSKVYVSISAILGQHPSEQN